MTHTPKQTDVQGRGVVLRRLEPGVVAHDCRTGVSVCLLSRNTVLYVYMFLKKMEAVVF